ncbi:MAG: thrombospondin type 3 repeat-containing protein [Myxococcota bacterium]
MSSLALGLAFAACGDSAKKRPIGEVCGNDGDCEAGLCLEGQCLDPEADNDGDGLINRVEGALGSNPLNPDSDYDGVRDNDEVNGVDPRDTDGDGVADINESIVTDADQDCLPDELDPDNGTAATDLSPAVPTLCSRNGVCRSEIDQVTLTCDAEKHPVCVYTAIATYEAEESTCDGLDNDCDGKTDEGFRDSDGDGIADCADDDVDGDGAAQATDNCPLIANADQADADGDDLGDACDPPGVPKLGAFTPAAPSNDTTPTSHGTAEKGAVVAVFTDASCTTKVGQGSADATGAFSFDLTLTGTGVIQLYVQATNSAGLTSACTLGGSFEIDLTAPSAALNFLARASAWDEGGATFEFSGLVEPFAAVDVFEGASCSGEPLRILALADGSFTGSGSYPDTTGATSYKVTDVAGNVSSCVVGPTLFGEVTVDTTIGDQPQVGTGVQFHYPDGSPLALEYTGDDGLAKHVVFAGCAVTVAIESTEGSARWVTVWDVAPGQTVPVAAHTSKPGIDRSDAIEFTWTSTPEGATYYDVLTSCGSSRFYPDGPQTTFDTTYYGGCLGLTTFDAVVLAHNQNGDLLGFGTALDNLVPENSDHQTVVTFADAWRTDFQVFSTTFVNIAVPSPVTAQAQMHKGDVQFGAAYLSGFGIGSVTLQASLAKLAGTTFDYEADVFHLSSTGGYGVRGEAGRDSGPTHTIDVAALPPRVFDAGFVYEQTTETGSYTGFQWAAEEGLSKSVEAGIFEGSLYGQNGSLKWQILLAPRGDEGEVLFPQVDPDFPGLYLLDTVYYSQDGNVTWYDYPEHESYGDVIDGCGDDIVKCLRPASKTTFTACCNNNNRGL